MDLLWSVTEKGYKAQDKGGECGHGTHFSHPGEILPGQMYTVFSQDYYRNRDQITDCCFTGQLQITHFFASWLFIVNVRTAPPLLSSQGSCEDQMEWCRWKCLEWFWELIRYVLVFVSIIAVWQKVEGCWRQKLHFCSGLLLIKVKTGW
jgi:hypothetical protein